MNTHDDIHGFIKRSESQARTFALSQHVIPYAMSSCRKKAITRCQADASAMLFDFLTTRTA